MTFSISAKGVHPVAAIVQKNHKVMQDQLFMQQDKYLVELYLKFVIVLTYLVGFYFEFVVLQNININKYTNISQD